MVLGKRRFCLIVLNMSSSESFKQLKRCVSKLANDHRYEEYDAFAYWYCQAALIDEDETELIKAALTNGANEKDCDIILINEENRTVNLCQAKYRTKLASSNENKKDILALIGTAEALISSKEDFEDFISDAHRRAKVLLTKARERFLDNNFDIVLHFVTPANIKDSDKHNARRACTQLCADYGLDPDRITYVFVSGTAITDCFDDFELRSPFIPEIRFNFIGDVCQPFKEKRPVESYVFCVRVKEISRLYRQFQDKLFAKNIRLAVDGEKSIPKDIRNTLLHDPDNFFYMNNGITILAGELEKIDDRIHIMNPQIINGQQTTRNIGKLDSGSIKDDAVILIKAIALRANRNRSKDDVKEIVSGIIRSTNSQNPVKVTQLVSNNKEHIILEKNLYQENWHYVRKIGKYDTEPKRYRDLGSTMTGKFTIEQLAMSLLSNEVDPQIVPRDGSKKVFDQNNQKLYKHYKTIFRTSKKTGLYLFSYLVSEMAKPSKRLIKSQNDMVLHRRAGRWYVSHALYKMLLHSFRVNEKRILRLLGHSKQGDAIKSKKLKEMSFLLHKAWKSFFEKFASRDHKDNPAAFYKHDVANINNWVSFRQKDQNYKAANRLLRELED